jgi:hypothetical protein
MQVPEAVWEMTHGALTGRKTIASHAGARFDEHIRPPEVGMQKEIYQRCKGGRSLHNFAEILATIDIHNDKRRRGGDLMNSELVPWYSDGRGRKDTSVRRRIDTRRFRRADVSYAMAQQKTGQAKDEPHVC